MKTPCPSDPELRCYSRGELDYAEATRLDEHLVGCDHCLARLDLLDHPPVRPEPNPSSRSAPANPPALERAIAAVLTGSGYDALPTLPGYQLLGRIGQGGMGTVCKAIHLRLGKTVAVKMLRRSRKNDPESIARFEREMRAVGRLDHPNIVRATDAGVADGVHFLVMEFVDGVDLSRLVRKHGPLPLAEACRYVIQAAAGLEAAHRHGMIHRDVKPSNLIRAADGTVKVLDLGLASLPFDPASDSSTDSTSPPEPSPELTATGHALGTRDYMPPEQRLAPNAVGPTADVYGLGATLCHLLTGHPPRPGTPLPSVLPEVIWTNLLHADPEQRFPSAAAAATALEPFATAPAPTATTPNDRTRVSRRVLVGVLTVAAVTVAVLLSRGRPAAPSERPAYPSLRIPFSAADAVTGQQVVANLLSRPVVEDGPHGFRFVWIPPGEFGLATECRVTLTRPYQLSACEVTVGQFRQFVEATGHVTSAVATGKGGFALEPDFVRGGSPNRLSNPKWNWANPPHPDQTDAHPVCLVSWDDAMAFCRWLGPEYRLPTEAEWTWAAKCGASADGLIANPERIGWLRSNARQPQPVGGREPNPWGLFDTFGNVAEWCSDRAAPFPSGSFVDYAGSTDEARGKRIFLGYSHLTPAFKYQPLRDSGSPDHSFAHVGFRVLRQCVSE